jgi:hypothetical protein
MTTTNAPLFLVLVFFVAAALLVAPYASANELPKDSTSTIVTFEEDTIVGGSIEDVVLPANARAMLDLVASIDLGGPAIDKFVFTESITVVVGESVLDDETQAFLAELDSMLAPIIALPIPGLQATIVALRE